MSVVVHPTKIFNYFNNIVDQDKVQKPHSFFIARSICHIAVQIIGHSDNYQCYCFSCRICRLSLTVLLSRMHRRLLCIIKKNNYASGTDNYVYREISRLIKKKIKEKKNGSL